MIISTTEKEFLDTNHMRLQKEADKTACFVVTGLLLLIPSLIVLMCGCILLTLPGINLIDDFFLKAYVPGLPVLLASIPFFVLARTPSEEVHNIRERLITETKKLLEEHKPKEKDSSDIVEKLLPKQCHDNYKFKFLGYVADTYDKEDPMAKVLNKAKGGIFQKKK